MKRNESVSDKKQADSLCRRCNSYSYCANRSRSVQACIHFNKFPRESQGGEHK